MIETNGWNYVNLVVEIRMRVIMLNRFVRMTSKKNKATCAEFLVQLVTHLQTANLELCN